MKKTLKTAGIIYMALCMVSYITWIFTLMTDKESLEKYLEFSCSYTANLYYRINKIIKKVTSLFSINEVDIDD